MDKKTERLVLKFKRRLAKNPSLANERRLDQQLESILKLRQDWQSKRLSKKSSL